MCGAFQCFTGTTKTNPLLPSTRQKQKKTAYEKQKTSVSGEVGEGPQKRGLCPNNSTLIVETMCTKNKEQQKL